jgi:hypothetical protein
MRFASQPPHALTVVAPPRHAQRQLFPLLAIGVAGEVQANVSVRSRAPVRRVAALHAFAAASSARGVTSRTWRRIASVME